MLGTVEKIGTENILKKETDKLVEKVEKALYKSRNFQIKPTGLGFGTMKINRKLGLVWSS